MNFILNRKYFRDDGIFGEMTSEDGLSFFITLEHSDKDKPIVPQGTYKCVRYDSPKHGYVVFMLEDVPGHDHVEIHIGNYNKDSEGCILIGLAPGNMSNGGRMLTCSKQAFERFMKLQSDVESFNLIISDCKGNETK